MPLPEVRGSAGPRRACHPFILLFAFDGQQCVCLAWLLTMPAPPCWTHILACCKCAAIESRLLVAAGQRYDLANPRHDLSEQQLVVSRRQHLREHM